MKQNRAAIATLVMLSLLVIIVAGAPTAIATPEPNPPTDLLTEGQTNPTDITDVTPEFSAIFTDDDVGDNAENMEIQVGILDEKLLDSAESGWTWSFQDEAELHGYEGDVYGVENDNSWFTEGTGSLKIAVENGQSWGGDYGMWSKEFNLENVIKLFFDYDGEGNYVLKGAQIFIGDTEIWYKKLGSGAQENGVVVEIPSSLRKIDNIKVKLSVDSVLNMGRLNVDNFQFQFIDNSIWASGWIDIFKVTDFQLNPATGTGTNTANLNDADILTTAELDAVDEYFEIAFSENFIVTDWRQYGHIDGYVGNYFKIQFWYNNAWVNSDTSLAFRESASWSGWITLANPFVTDKVRLTATAINLSFGSGYIREFEMKATTVENNMRFHDVSYAGSTLSRGVTYYWKSRFMDASGAEGPWSTETATFMINDSPNPPTSLLSEGQTNPIRITNLMPEFSAIGTDNDGDQMNYYALQIDDDSGFGTPTYNKTKTSITAFDNGARSPDISYENSDLSRGASYYWRIKFWDNNDVEGMWSTETATFRINQLPTTTNLEIENQTNPTRVTTLTPTFSWMYSDPDEDNQSHWLCWVGTSSGTNDKWNSGELSGDNNSDVYGDGGSALSRGITYYVQVMTKDNFGWSDWVTGTFRINQLPTQTYSEQTFYDDYTPTLIWYFSDPDGDDQLGVNIQVDNDPGFGSLLWDYSDNTTIAQSKVYAGEALEKNVTYYARVQVRDGYEWSGTWSDNTFTILPIPSLIVAEVTVDSTPVDRKAHWSGDGDVRIYATVKDNEGRDAIENVHFWIRDNNDAVVVDNAMHIGYENVNDNTKRLWYDYSPSDIMLDNALGEFDVKVQAVSVNFENTKDYTDFGFKLFTVDDHSIAWSPIREIYAEGEIITFEPIVESIATGSAVENAYLKLELISELGEVLRTVTGYTNGSGKLATHTTLLEADVGFYDVRISTGKGAIDGLKLYEDAFTVAAELLVSVESITPADDAVSGLLRSRSVVPEDVIVKVLVFDTAGTELLNLISDPMRVENTAPQLKPWQVPYGLTLAEGTYSYRVEVWESDLGTLHHVAFAEVRLTVAPSQQAVGDWLATDTIEIDDGKFDVVLYRESIVTNPEPIDKANFFFREIVPAPQGSTVMVKVSGMPLQTLSVDQYGTITKYFDVPASETLKITMEVTIACAVKIKVLGETEVVAASVPKTVAEHKYKITNLTSTTLRQLELTFPVSGVVAVMDEDGVPIVKFWETESTVVEIPILEPYGEMILTLTAEKAPSLPDILEGLVTWTIYGIPIVIPLLVVGAVVAVLTRKKTGPISKVILLLLPLGIFVGMWMLGVI